MKKTLLILAVAATLIGCHKQPIADAPTFAKGADLGWLSEMEHDSMLFYHPDGKADDCIEVMKAIGCDAIRLRVWVNHSTGWCNLPDVLAMAKRVHAAGLRLMIDFHYSDYWADPSHQDIPADWKALDLNQMCIAIGAHTTEVLEALKAEGIEPEWVQIGNETTNGMLWPMGALDAERVAMEAQHEPMALSRERCLDWANYARLSNSGYEAAKAVFPNVTCIIHVDNAFVPRVNWFYRFQQEGGKWDAIGLSHYPFTQDTLTWQQMNELCRQDVQMLHQTYQCPVIITEIGIRSNEPASADSCIADFRQRMDTLPGYAGVFYWEPEVYNYWKPAEYEALGWGSYNMGAFTNEGRPMEALIHLYE